MATITVKLTSVSPDPLIVGITASPNTTITWNAGSDVQNFQVSGLDSSVFGVTGSNGYVTTFTVTDNGTPGHYDYNVQATAKTGSSEGECDPRITNEAGHPPPDKDVSE